MRCHGTGWPSASTLSLASWTRFSPSAGDPGRDGRADPLDRSTVLETAMRSTSSGERPARAARGGDGLLDRARGWRRCRSCLPRLSARGILARRARGSVRGRRPRERRDGHEPSRPRPRRYEKKRSARHPVQSAQVVDAAPDRARPSGAGRSLARHRSSIHLPRSRRRHPGSPAAPGNAGIEPLDHRLVHLVAARADRRADRGDEASRARRPPR